MARIWEGLLVTRRQDSAPASMPKENNGNADETPCFLYRHFSAAGQLLYVGIAGNAVGRSRQHAKTSKWFADVVRIDILRCKNRKEAIEKEKMAIMNENPIFNVHHRTSLQYDEESRAENSRDDLRRKIAVNPIYRIGDASKALGISTMTIRNEIDNGRLGTVIIAKKTGRREVFITGWQIIDWLEHLESRDA